MQAFFKDIFSSSRKLSLLLIFLFFISVLWRIPGYYTGSYPASVPYTQIMQTANIWNDHGPSDFNFGAVQSYPKPEDAFVHHYDRFLDHRGLNYYVSYPPLIFWVGYTLCQFTGPAHLHEGLLVFNLLLHLLSMWGMYTFFKDHSPKMAFWLASLWLVLPVTLDIFYRVFFSEALTTALFAWLPWFLKKGNQTYLPKKWGVFWMLFSFGLAYNDWLGGAVAAGAGLALMVMHPKRWLTIILGWLGVVAAWGLFIWQYSELASFDALLDALLFRYMLREHVQAVTLPWHEAGYAALWYAFGWGLTLIILCLLLLGKTLTDIKKHHLAFIWSMAIGIPLSLNFYFFFTFSVHHAYNFARWVPWIIVGLGWGCTQIDFLKRGLPWLVCLLAIGNLPIHFSRLEAMMWDKAMIDAFPDFQKQVLPTHTIYIQIHGFKGDLPGGYGFVLKRSMDEVFRPEEIPVKAYLDGQPHWQFLDVAPGKPVVHFTYKDFPEGWLNRPARCLGEKGRSAVLPSFQAMSGQRN
jgi:hypothetical protein